MSLNMLSYFMQVLNSTRKHYTKNDYFPMHIMFTRIYLLQEEKLNPNKYSEQEINMSNFVQAKEYNLHMNAKFGYSTFCVFLYLNTPIFDL
jgi:hypothetical protein